MPRKRDDIWNVTPSMLERFLAAQPDRRQSPEARERCRRNTAAHNAESKRKAEWTHTGPCPRDQQTFGLDREIS
jgi:hypothetical protein